jgi:NitT/TauT family transport system substrate-binding protein
MRKLAATAALLALTLLSGAARANEKVALTLNWTIGSDHAPIYYALSQGLYAAAGLDLSIEIGKGSAYAAQRAGIGAAQFGIVDMPTAIQAKGEGADIVGLMVIYQTSPYTVYWKKSSGIKTIKDLAGHSIGTPAADAARQMWPLIAKTVGIEASTVRFVNVAPDAKFAALQSGTIDATTNFYNFHYIAERTFKEDLGFLRLADIGFNPYGNAFFVNGAYLKEHKEAVRHFVEVTQKAYATCLATPEPCVDAVVKAASQDPRDLALSWKLVAELAHSPKPIPFVGYIDPERMASDYETVKSAFPLKDFDVKSMYTDEFLDKTIMARN